MLFGIIFDPLTLVLACSSIFALVACGITLRKQAKVEKRLVKKIDALSKELNALNHSTLGMGRRIQGVVDKHDSLEISVEEIHRNDPVKVSYSEAGRLVRMGASVEELMSACSISRPEAELVSALTKQAQEKEDVPVLNTKS